MPRRKHKPYVLGDNVTPVIFRRWANTRGGIIALFPYAAWDSAGAMCTSFEHHGQHGGADPASVIARTVPATLDEAGDLIMELTSSPYYYPPLRILKRIPAGAAAFRRESIAR